GGKISTKLILLEKLLTKTDVLLLGGGIANTMLKAQGYEIGKSICEDNLLPDAKKLLAIYSSHIVLPTDVIITTMDGHISCVQLDHIAPTDTIKDIGDETITRFSQIIGTAKTILWNGPLGYFEQKPFDSGTQKIYEAVIQNTQATSVVGGGDTIAAL